MMFLTIQNTHMFHSYSEHHLEHCSFTSSLTVATRNTVQGTINIQRTGTNTVATQNTVQDTITIYSTTTTTLANQNRITRVYLAMIH